jgi:hypothetical protein
MTWRLQLHELDELQARYTQWKTPLQSNGNPEAGTSWVMPREHWEEVGCPVDIEISLGGDKFPFSGRPIRDEPQA